MSRKHEIARAVVLLDDMVRTEGTPPDTRVIYVQGVRHHNLKGFDLAIPKYSLTVVTGVSGSGKSSLAFETVYAEGQRRFLETLSTYARQFIRQMEKPAVERIIGLQPAIAIEQRRATAHPRSTVGTVTEIYDYLRLLFTHAGTMVCPDCRVEVQPQTVPDMATMVMHRWAGAPVAIAAPIVRHRKGAYRRELEQTRRRGYTWACIDGTWVRLDSPPRLARTRHHTIDIVIDRVIVQPERRNRILQALQTAVEMTRGFARVIHWETMESALLSTACRCPRCDRTLPEMDPLLFAFNSPQGACMVCEGMGQVHPSIARRWRQYPRSIDQLDASIRWAVWREWNTEDERLNWKDRTVTCPACAGTRLRDEARYVYVHGKSITDLCRMEIQDLYDWLRQQTFTGMAGAVAQRILPPILQRLAHLIDVGLGYLTLDRWTATLSTGELQRVRLAAQTAQDLRGVLYVLDEPTVGLHPEDTARMIRVLRQLRDRGNTVIVVEHDEMTIRAADFIVDLGPGAGERGGHLLAAAPADTFIQKSTTLTARYLRKEKVIPQRSGLPLDRVPWVTVRNIRCHNIRGVDIRFPVGRLIAVTGVSGSGKSTLVFDVLYTELHRWLRNPHAQPERCEAIEGAHHFRRVVVVDASPIGRTPRSTPTTYIGVMDDIRRVFASQPTARVWGYGPGRFSFNVTSGQCPACRGMGYQRIQMHFMPDTYLLCETCGGRRYNPDTLKVTWRGRTIADVLEMTAQEALAFFAPFPSITRKLQYLCDLALGYLRLGQPSHTLSGGESQRLKLVRELARRSGGDTLYLLDEPTTGLHPEDIQHLLRVLDRLVRRGDTVIVIEHHLDVIRNADYVIDLGPGPGRFGGSVVVSGPPEVIARHPKSRTGRFLQQIL